jgi:glycosyltransferase involved in cell wall biosynthesis
MTNTSYLFSTIIPCYNSNLIWLSQCIESVVLSMSKIKSKGEIIIVDDGSKIDIRGILVGSIPENKEIPIHFVKKQNGGLSSARNEGYRRAQGAYCHFIDDDDFIAINFYSEMEAEILRCAPKVLYCNSEFFSSQGKLPFNPIAETEFSRKMVKGNCVHVNAVVVRTELLHSVGGFDEDLNALEDWDLWLKLIRLHQKFKHVPLILANVRLHPNSMSQNRSKMYSRMYEVILREMRDHSHFWLQNFHDNKEIHEWVINAFSYSSRSEHPLRNSYQCFRASIYLVGSWHSLYYALRQSIQALLVPETSPHSKLWSVS